MDNLARKHFSNGILSMAFDAMSGELIELTDEKSGDNLIKNHLPEAHTPFTLELTQRDGRVRELAPARFAQSSADPGLRAAFQETLCEDGRRQMEVRYGRLVSEGDVLDVAVTYRVILEPGSCVSRWHIRVENGTPDWTVTKVVFPRIHGIIIGDTWTDDTLVYPYIAGLRIPNPVEDLAKKPVYLNWKWQEYNYIYTIDGCGTAYPDGSFRREQAYTGPLSMMWLDYFEDDLGLYLAGLDPDFKVAALRAETFGPDRPGMGFAIIKYPDIAPGQSWDSPPCELAVHPGDWHWGADRYRQWRRSQGEERFERPGWFDKSAGLVAHYDFKYQNGGVVHRFCDIPGIYREALEMGLNHLLISGWHQDGFDNGFPKYRPDPELGSREEFIENVQEVRRQGGHVAFYINSQLCNTRYDDLRSMITDCAVRDRKGKPRIDHYGNHELEFAVMCSGSDKWREFFTGVIGELTGEVGADSMYLDQLVMASANLCYHPDHAHSHDGWNDGYRKLLSGVRNSYGPDNQPAILYEGVSDVHGWGVSGQLVSTFFYYFQGAYPELYKYTFPDEVMVDMLYPMRGQAMRPVYIVRHFRELINRAFLVGSYFWIYDLEEDNTFARDPENREYLRQVIALRKFWLERWGHGTFRDTVGIVNSSHGVTVRRYDVAGGVLLAISNLSGISGEKVELDLGMPNTRLSAEVYELGRYQDAVSISLEMTESGFVGVALPSTPLSLIHIVE